MATITSPRTASPASITPRIKSPSIADTPTSSVRGSLEAPRNPSVAVGPAPAQRRGNRAALRDYYNLKSKTPQQGNLSRTASITSTTSEVSTTSTLLENNSVNTTSALTAQLDNQDFDPQGYISNLLSTSSLRDILRVEATLVSEIRNLDGERKALVYDNYSKLIKAVGTIGEMQKSMNAAGGGLTEVSELDGRLERLRNMATILGTPERSDVKAREERRKCRKEGSQQKTKIDVVRRVLAAPETLKMLMNEDRETEAREEWDQIRMYLASWKDVKGVSSIQAQCESIMRTTFESKTQGDDHES